MKTRHLTDTEIQEYAFGSGPYAPETEQHYRECPICSRKVQLYQQIATELPRQHPPALDPATRESILSGIRPSVRKPSLTIVFCYILAGICLIIIASACYLIRNDLARLFAGAAFYMVPLALGVFLVLLFFQGAALINTQRQQLKSLEKVKKMQPLF